jgi:hypothetical protein
MAVGRVSGHAEVRCVARDANVFSSNRHLWGLGRGSSHPTISELGFPGSLDRRGRGQAV